MRLRQKISSQRFSFTMRPEIASSPLLNRELSARDRLFIGIASLGIVIASLIVAWVSLGSLFPGIGGTNTATVSVNSVVGVIASDSLPVAVTWGSENDYDPDAPLIAGEQISEAQRNANVAAAKGWLAEAFRWAPREESAAPWTPNALNPFDTPWDKGIERANQRYGFAERITFQLSGLDSLRAVSDRVARRHFTVTAETIEITGTGGLTEDIFLITRLDFAPLRVGNPNHITSLNVHSRFQVRNGLVTNALIESVELAEVVQL